MNFRLTPCLCLAVKRLWAGLSKPASAKGGIPLSARAGAGDRLVDGPRANLRQAPASPEGARGSQSFLANSVEIAEGAELRGRPLRISIVVPNFNGAAFIAQTLQSVIDQGYPDLELIVVDGASTDDSLAVIEKFRPHIAMLIVEPDRGHADALNKGFAVATGDIFGWINSDDILLAGSLSFIDRLFRRRPDVDWATGRPTSMDSKGEITWVGPLRPWSRLRFLAGDNKWIQQESTFWRRSLWEKAGAGLDLRYSVANDFDLWRRFFRHADLHAIDRYLGCFRIREGQRSIKFKSLYEREMRQILDEELTTLDDAFRGAFDVLIPASARGLKQAGAIAADPRFKICDPPVISAGEVLGWAPARVNGSAAKAGVALAPSNLEGFRDRHKGERCFIMGNGPSLNRMDLSLLKGETVFACNGVFLLFDRVEWRPKYYACVDSRVLPDRAPEIDAMLKANSSMNGFFPVLLHEHVDEKKRRATRMLLPPDHNRWYFNERPNATDDLPWSMFSTDINNHVIQPHTVAITMLQIAAYMGFSELILIGCDTNYVVAPSVARDASGLALTSTADDDANHFDKTYFGGGRKWHDPQPDKMIAHYGHAKAALDAIGVRVINATVGGRLEVFPRRDFTSLFAAGADVVSPRDVPPRETPPAPSSEGAMKPVQEKSSLQGLASRIASSSPMLRKFRAPLLAALLALGVVVAAALIVGRSPAQSFVLFGGVFLLLGGALAMVAFRLRGFIVELSQQVSDIANHAGRPPEGAVIAKIELEDEIARLREEVARLDEILARERSGRPPQA